MEKLILSADIGGSHITAALVDLDKKKELSGTWSRTKLNSAGTSTEIINTWAETLEKSSIGHDLKSLKINIAMPGPMNYRSGICKIKDQGKYESLYNLNIKQMLASRLGIQPSAIHFINDAACFLKGEVFSGSLEGYDHAIGLTLGTGLGTSYLVNGKVVDSGLWCMPFLNGIAEDYISTRWFIKRFDELAGISIKDVKDLVDNHAGSPCFNTVFAEFSINLAGFIHKFIRKKMPLAVVLGGNIAQADAHFINDTRKHLATLMGYSLPVKKSMLGEKAALLGAGSAN
ncbi:MAG: ROK family protein [Candidatus Pedobacter colombiensis]|uniref:ROK family protein n=1 Tax=Candidatus Pedobacter colombiensis TaxID=3121371 RepID=A0AAJ5W644_9SPHI|nr:ROK family protein [Pedobacter sp.]WEK17818.1 MAG: ROK family protein [Pedobacter sp.]